MSLNASSALSGMNEMREPFKKSSALSASTNPTKTLLSLEFTFARAMSRRSVGVNTCRTSPGDNVKFGSSSARPRSMTFDVSFSPITSATSRLASSESIAPPRKTSPTESALPVAIWYSSSTAPLTSITSVKRVGRKRIESTSPAFKMLERDTSRDCARPDSSKYNASNFTPGGRIRVPVSSKILPTGKLAVPSGSS